MGLGCVDVFGEHCSEASFADIDLFRCKAEEFVEKLPYKASPFSGRAWGNPVHSLCSYYGKLKPSIAHFLVREFTSPGDTVLDPLCGVGTIPFEACLLGRKGYGNDLSELAFIVTKAKIEPPSFSQALKVVTELEAYIEDNRNTETIRQAAAGLSEFGFNKKLPEYFHQQTFLELLCAREYFQQRISAITSSEAMVFSALLHVLHGNRPYALSRTSHPITPYAPSGEFVYKNVVSHITKKLKLSCLNAHMPLNFRQGRAIKGDFSLLGDDMELKGKVDAVICSPPFADSIKFYMSNWMRLWLCGWNSEDFNRADSLFLDGRQQRSFSVYDSFFKVCGQALKTDGRVILHLGKTKRTDMARELSGCWEQYFERIYCGSENVCEIESHGIKDKGATFEHQFLFLVKKRRAGRLNGAISAPRS